MRKSMSALSLMIAFPLLNAAHAAARPIVTATLDHVAIQASDLKRSVAFYEEVFGFSRLPTPLPGAQWLGTGNGVALHIVGNRSTPSEHSRWDHMALACDDMDAMIARLNTRRIAWTDMDGRHVPQVRPDGVKQIFVQDPDGYWIEINDMARPKR